VQRPTSGFSPSTFSYVFPSYLDDDTFCDPSLTIDCSPPIWQYWTSLTPHSLCVLISTVILLERLRHLHPGLSSTGRASFSSYPPTSGLQQQLTRPSMFSVLQRSKTLSSASSSRPT
jgi:hypothetical protein